MLLNQLSLDVFTFPLLFNVLFAHDFVCIFENDIAQSVEMNLLVTAYIQDKPVLRDRKINFQPKQLIFKLSLHYTAHSVLKGSIRLEITYVPFCRNLELLNLACPSPVLPRDLLHKVRTNWNLISPKH